MLTAQQVDEILEATRPIQKWRAQAAYFHGNNVGILSALPQSDPDNRNPVPIARRAVLLTKGYMGKPGNISYTGEGYDADTESDSTVSIEDVYDSNDEALKTANAMERALYNGVAFELHWTEDNEPRFALVPIEQAYPVFSHDLEPKILAFVWHRCQGEMELATVYDSDAFVTYTRKEKGGETWNVDLALSGLHGYLEVPVVMFQIDSDGRNLFDHAIPLLDTLDRIVSEDIANELQRFANAYLLLASSLSTDVDENGLTEVDYLKKNKIIENLNSSSSVQGQAAFLTRDINGSFIAESANRVERLIYEALMLFNPNDSGFSGDSGTAQAYKLLGFEYLCANIESYFSKGLYHRLRLMGNILKSLFNQGIDTDSIQVVFKRELPFDLERKALVAAQLSGIWDLEAILNLFPANVLSSEDKERILEAKAGMEALPEPPEVDPNAPEQPSPEAPTPPENMGPMQPEANGQ
jgi:SPP1 family phage portal protein